MWMFKVGVDLKGMRESKRDRKRRNGKKERKNASLSCPLRGFHGAVAEVRGRQRAREN